MKLCNFSQAHDHQIRNSNWTLIMSKKGLLHLRRIGAKRYFRFKLIIFVEAVVLNRIFLKRSGNNEQLYRYGIIC